MKSKIKKFIQNFSNLQLKDDDSISFYGTTILHKNYCLFFYLPNNLTPTIISLYLKTKNNKHLFIFGKYEIEKIINFQKELKKYCYGPNLDFHEIELKFYFNEFFKSINITEKKIDFFKNQFKFFLWQPSIYFDFYQDLLTGNLYEKNYKKLNYNQPNLKNKNYILIKNKDLHGNYGFNIIDLEKRYHKKFNLPKRIYYEILDIEKVKKRIHKNEKRFLSGIAFTDEILIFKFNDQYCLYKDGDFYKSLLHKPKSIKDAMKKLKNNEIFYKRRR